MPVIHQKQYVRLQPSAHLNAQGATVLQAQLAAIEPEKGDTWLIDMAQVEFIDSAGILVLANTLKFAHRHGCRVKVCHLRPAIQLVFEITQLDKAIDIVDRSNITAFELSSISEASAA